MPQTKRNGQANPQPFIPFIQQQSTFHLSRLNIATFIQEINSACRERSKDMNISSNSERNGNQHADSKLRRLTAPPDKSPVLGQRLIACKSQSYHQRSSIFNINCIVGDKGLSCLKWRDGFSYIFCDRIISLTRSSNGNRSSANPAGSGPPECLQTEPRRVWFTIVFAS